MTDTVPVTVTGHTVHEIAVEVRTDPTEADALEISAELLSDPATKQLKRRKNQVAVTLFYSPHRLGKIAVFFKTGGNMPVNMRQHIAKRCYVDFLRSVVPKIQI